MNQKSVLTAVDLPFHASEFARLREELQEASRASTLPDGPSGQAALSDLLVRMRLART